jgi:hypothetical protein
MIAALLSGLALLAQTTSAVQPGTKIVSCDLPAPVTGAAARPTPAPRVFEIGAGMLREWNTVAQQFGPNLCATYSCSKTKGRIEGSISSSSVKYSVGIETATGDPYWRATGASGLAKPYGACKTLKALPTK